MKIIDFEKLGNLVRFYLGKDDLEDWAGDDWNDEPYEYNAERVNENYISGIKDIVFPYNMNVVEPCDGYTNSHVTKDDMKKRIVPCICACEKTDDYITGVNFENVVRNAKCKRFYFGDNMEPSNEIEVYNG